MRAASQIHEKMSLCRSLGLAGISRCMWYHTLTPRNVRPDPDTVDVVQRIGLRHPTYGTRRMAA